jgi:AcrR family transcriptional regulator
MPKTEAQLERVREESRERILAAALALFARQGYERTSIREIAREAGISQGLMYNYYAGKDELLGAIFARRMAAAREAFSLAPAEAPPGERIERLIRKSLALVGRDVEFWRLSYSLRMQPSVLRGGAEEIRAWSESLRREIEAVLAAAGVADAGVEAAVLFALIDGVAQHHAMAPRRYPLEQVTGAIVARYRALCS